MTDRDDQTSVAAPLSANAPPARSCDATRAEAVATRRALLLGVGAMSAAGVLAACGAEGSAGATPTAGPATTPGGSGVPTTGAASPTGGGPFTAKTSDIPVGSGTIFKDEKIVITQPTAGTYKAFDATCRHLGCPVGAVANAKIICTCHGSQYNIADGSVARGPTEAGLTVKTVKVSGGTITVT